MGFEEDGRATRGKKHAGGMFLSPGENPITKKQRIPQVSSVFVQASPLLQLFLTKKLL